MDFEAVKVSEWIIDWATFGYRGRLVWILSDYTSEAAGLSELIDKILAHFESDRPLNLRHR